MEQSVTEEKKTEVIRRYTWRDRLRLVTYACGHRDTRRFELHLHGHVVDPTDEHLQKRERCGACELVSLQKTAVFCAWCSALILKGDAVSLCEPHDAMTGPRTLVQAPYGIRVVGCLHVGCAHGTDDWAGNWAEGGVLRPLSISSSDQRDLFLRIPPEPVPSATS